MKKLSIEEKAKRYDKALERAKIFKEHLLEINDKGYADEMNYIFPELKQSDGERIRGAIIHFISHTPTVPKGIINKEQMLAWLEKQKELTSDEEKQGKEDVLWCINQAKKHAKDENEMGTCWFAEKWLEKQGDSAIPQVYETKNGEVITYSESEGYKVVEPKFRNGQWIVWQDKCYKVNYNGCGYELVDQNGFSTSLEYGTIDENAHFWTIQDAKPGDVLFYKGNVKHSDRIKFDRILLFKNLDKSFFVLTKFSNGAEDYAINANIDYSDNILPATKEQRDILMKAMADAGFTFAFEKKELKKIEDEEYDGEDCGIDSLYHAQRILEKTLGSVDGYQSDDGILDHKAAITAVKKLYEQKPAWSEEDALNRKWAK